MDKSRLERVGTAAMIAFHECRIHKLRAIAVRLEEAEAEVMERLADSDRLWLMTSQAYFHYRLKIDADIKADEADLAEIRAMEWHEGNTDEARQFLEVMQVLTTPITKDEFERSQG